MKAPKVYRFECGPLFSGQLVIEAANYREAVKVASEWWRKTVGTNPPAWVRQ